jgi:hypothetical protein
VSEISSKTGTGHGFYIGVEDVEASYSTRIYSHDPKPVLGRRKDPAWGEFEDYRDLGIDELHPGLSDRILYEFGLDPYSEKDEVDSEILARDSCEAIRVADTTESHYLVLEGSEPEIFSGMERFSYNDIF